MQIKISKSLGGGFQGDPKTAWGGIDYTDRYKPVVFCGMYDLRDYITLYRHKGKAYVFWCGSDLLNLKEGFIFNNGKLKWLSKILRGNWWVKLILKKAEHWVENRVEEDVLLKLGIVSFVCPSFFGKVEDFKECYEHRIRPRIYISCGKNRQKEYGFDAIERIADKCPLIDFYLYGDDWGTKHKNVHVRGRIPIDQMNMEIKKMQCGLSLNEFSGFSEITAKAVLWGQYAITRFYNPFVMQAKTDEELISCLNQLTHYLTPNICGRIYYQHKLNKFPFNEFSN